jgi:ribosomal protein L31
MYMLSKARRQEKRAYLNFDCMATHIKEIFTDLPSAESMLDTGSSCHPFFRLIAAKGMLNLIL